MTFGSNDPSVSVALCPGVVRTLLGAVAQPTCVNKKTIVTNVEKLFFTGTPFMNRKSCNADAKWLPEGKIRIGKQYQVIKPE